MRVRERELFAGEGREGERDEGLAEIIHCETHKNRQHAVHSDDDVGDNVWQGDWRGVRPRLWSGRRGCGTGWAYKQLMTTTFERRRREKEVGKRQIKRRRSKKKNRKREEKKEKKKKAEGKRQNKQPDRAEQRLREQRKKLSRDSPGIRNKTCAPQKTPDCVQTDARRWCYHANVGMRFCDGAEI